MTCCVMSTNNIEIERKYRVLNESYKQLATKAVCIRQGYLCLNENCSVRVRQWDDKGYLTIKSHAIRGSFSRYEFEKEISVEEATELFALALPGRIEKTRWLVPMENGLVCEVDEFAGENAGLTIAEVELTSETQTFAKPAFLGEEVTNDPRFFNSYLSQHPYNTW